MQTEQPRSSFPGSPVAVYRFGVFEFNLDSRHILKAGRELHLQEQPLRLLALLLEQPGGLRTREELQKLLWPTETFVEFDDGLNTAIQKIRQVLGDEARNRQFRQPPVDFVVNLPFSGNDIPQTTTSQGFPIVTTVPDLRRELALFALRGVTPDYRNGQMQQFNFSVQRELSKELLAAIGYVGSACAKLYRARNINLPEPGPGAVDPRRPYAAPLPCVTGITWLETSANSFYPPMQTAIEKRFGSGFYFLGNRTRSHSLDNFGGDGGNNGPIPQDPKNCRAHWASSNSDASHRVNLASTYQLPFGPGCKYFGSGAAGHIVGGWEIGGIAVLQSGLPYTVQVPGSPSNTGSTSRANPVAGVNPNPANRSINLWFDPAAFTTPAAFTWGTLGHNTLNAPALYNPDFYARKIKFKELCELQFRSEFFNGLNHPQFALPNATIGVGGAGTITSTQRSNRQVQFALRLAF